MKRKVITLTEEGERMLREILGTHIPQPKRTSMVHQLILDEYRRLIEAGIIPAAPEGEE